MCDVDHGVNCECIRCPCLKHKGCQHCETPTKIAVASTPVSEYKKKYFEVELQPSHRRVSLGMNIPDSYGLKFHAVTEQRAEYIPYTFPDKKTIMKYSSRQPASEAGKQLSNVFNISGTEKMSTLTSNKRDYPLYSNANSAILGVQKYSPAYYGSTGKFSSDTTNSTSYVHHKTVSRIDGKQVNQDYFNALKKVDMSEFKTPLNHTKDTYKNWKTRKPKTHVQDIYIKEDDDRTFETTTKLTYGTGKFVFN